MKRRSHKRLYIYASIVVAAAILGVAGYFINSHLNHDKEVSSKVIKTISSPNTNSESTNNPSSQTGNSNGSSNAKTPATTTTSPPGGSSVQGTLVAPSGTFVSNHNPDLSGQPYPSEEESTCNTSPGATCYIKFIGPSGQVKELPTQTTNASGSTQWTWDVNSSGFTVGKWQITAVASLNGASKSTTDQEELNVQP